MADSVINVVIAAKDEASKAFLAAARGADHLDAEQAAAAKSAGDLDRQAADTAAALDRQARSAEAAAAAAAKLAAAPTAGGAPAGATTPAALSGTARAADTAAASVSNLSGRVQTLRYNLMDVGQQLAGGGSPLMVLAQQGPEIAMALGSASEAATVLRGAFAPLIATASAAASALAVAGVAVAALGAALVVLKNATEEADEAGGRLSARMSETAARAAKLQEGFAGAVASVAALRRETATAELGLAELTGQIDRFTAAATRQKQALKDNTDATVLTLSGIEQAARAERQAAEANLRNTSVLTGMTAAQVEAAEASVRSARAREAAAKSAREEAERERDRQAEIIELEAEYRRETEASNEVLKDREEASRAAAKAAQDRAKAEREAAEAARQWAREQGMVNAAAQELAALAPELESLPDLIFSATWDGFASGLSESLTTLQKEMTGLAELFGKMLAEQIRKAARVGAAIGDVLGGNISAALARALPALGAKLAEAFAGNDGLLGKIASIAGPAGAAIGAAIQGVQALGENGPKATSNQIVGGLQSIIKGITNIPALLVKLIPDLLTKVLPDLIVALVGIIPRLAVAIVIELPVAIVRGIVLWWRDIGGFRGLARSIAEGVRDWWRDTWDRVKAWFKDIFTPGDQSRNRGRRGSAEERAAGQRAATNASLGLRDPTDQRVGLLASRRGSSRPAAGALVIQAASIHPDIVPRSARDIDRLYGAGGLRRGTISWGTT